MMADNNNAVVAVKTLAAQMIETKERAAAWVFRFLIGTLSMVLVVLGWFGIDKLTTFDKKFEQLDAQRANLVQNINQLAHSQSQEEMSMTRVETSLTDYIRNQDRISGQLANQAQDHEQRLRQLERPPR